MSGFLTSEDRPAPPATEALSRIEAALQAALHGDAGARGDRARQALRGDPADPDVHIEAWLEAVASELQSGAGALVPEEMVEAIAEKMLADPRRSIGAHGKIQGETIGNLVRRP
jgi:hypothetical protein